MNIRRQKELRALLAAAAIITLFAAVPAKAQDTPASSYSPVIEKEPFETVVQRMIAAKPNIAAKHTALLEERYDLSDRTTAGIRMSNGKAIQSGVRVKLSDGVTWEQLGLLDPAEIKRRNLWPAGFYPLPHPNHPEGGMVFLKHHIDEINRQEQRDLTRFDLDLDLPTHFLPEYPPPIYLTTRPDLGDVSKGKVVTIDNYYDLFNGILNP